MNRGDWVRSFGHRKLRRTAGYFDVDKSGLKVEIPLSPQVPFSLRENSLRPDRQLFRFQDTQDGTVDAQGKLPQIDAVEPRNPTEHCLEQAHHFSQAANAATG